MGTSVASAQSPEGEVERLDSAVVAISRASKSTPVTFTMLDKKQLRQASPMESLPMALQFQPSVVSSNEGGTGLGYSKLRVRGSKGSQINVTLNGITLNDAESQEVFWVNIPALGNLLSSVQLQRGLGTSESGSGAFGASINMNTSMVSQHAGGSFDIARGSWNTLTTAVQATTGLLSNGLYANFAYSKNSTDGYIRNAWADSESLLAVLGWLGESSSLRLTYLLGKQHTGITWEGIPASMLAEDRRYNPAGEWYDSLGNVHYYDNESDNYLQQHLQLNYTLMLTDNLLWTSTLNYTRGDGYYEQYKAEKKCSAYGLEPFEKDGQTYKKADFIINKSLANNYFVANSDLRYTTDGLQLTGGLSYSLYDGDHFGDILWNNITGTDANYRWYLNNGLKKDFSAYARANYAVAEGLNAYLDLQFRNISLVMSGLDDDAGPLDYSTSWAFFNPRLGLSYTPSKEHRLYFSAGIGHREPGRSDIKEVIISNNELDPADARLELKPETLLDIELGWEYSGERVSAALNLYDMEYWDMLLETGKLSDSGYALKENVGRAWRRGVEISAGVNVCRHLDLGGNIALSSNKLADFTAWYETYTDDWTPISQQHNEHYTNTTMLMSPSCVGAVFVDCKPLASASSSWNDLCIRLQGKYVGKQYWDNTQCEERSLPAYFVMDASLSKQFRFRQGNSLDLGLYVNNLLNNMYCADAWIYRAYFPESGKFYQEEGLFPQAPLSCMLRLRYNF